MNPFRFLQNNLLESSDSLPFSYYVNFKILRESAWILTTVLENLCANGSADLRRISDPAFCNDFERIHIDSRKNCAIH